MAGAKERCLVASLDQARIAYVPEGTCNSDKETLRYPLKPEVPGELDGTPINSDSGMDLVTCLISDTRGIFTTAVSLTKTECDMRDRDPWASDAMVVPDHVAVNFVPESIAGERDHTMVTCRTRIGDITTTRSSCQDEGGTELAAKQPIEHPGARVRCKIDFDEIWATADKCLRHGGVIVEEAED